MRKHIQAIVDDAISAIQSSGRIDVIKDLAYPLPVKVICEMLGVAEQDQAKFKGWTDDLATFVGNFRRAMQHVEVAQRSALEMIEYLRGIIKQCRENPRDDLISALVTAEEQGEKFSEEELYSMFVILQISGHETTTNLIANGMLALLQHPDQLEMLCADPALIENAVEEMLRFYCPIQSTGRIAIDDMELAGQSIRKGQLVQVVLGAASGARPGGPA